MFGSPGSMLMSAHPVFASTYNTFFQVLPPSLVRKTPRSSFAFHACPVAQTKTLSDFFGSMAMRAMRSLSPRPTFVQVAPPSVVLETLLRTHDSPVPTHTICGLVSSIVIAPIDCACSSKTGLNDVPLSVDFHTP